MFNKIFTIASYAFGALVVVGGTFILIAYGNGYTYDFKTGKLVHRGLLIVDSTPSGAKVTIDNKLYDDDTPFRKTLEAGTYNVSLERPEYHSWQKRLKVVPTLASLHQYVIMIPKKLTSKVLTTNDSMGPSSPSEDHTRLAYVVPTGERSGVWSIETDNGQTKQIYAPAAATESQSAETVELIEWSNDNSHVLVRSRIDDVASYVVIAANGNDEPININTTFNISPNNLAFNPDNWRELYWNNENGLQRLDVGNKTISAVLADNVQTYSFADDRILYVRKTTPASLWVLERSGQTRQLVKTLPTSSEYEIAYSTYQRNPKVAVVAKDSRQTVLYSDVFSRPTSITLPATGKQLDFNGDGRFLLQYDENHTSTYDLQEQTTYTFPATGGQITGISWFDTYHLVYNSGGQAIISEFDGNYARPVGPSNGSAPISAPNYRAVVVATPTAAGPVQIKSIIIRP